MIPGELLPADGDVELQPARERITLRVSNTGDRPIQVGSHFHFFEVNRALRFDRTRGYGMRLDLPAGTSVRFEPGDERDVKLVSVAGARMIYGLNGLTQGALDDPSVRDAALGRARERGFLSTEP